MNSLAVSIACVFVVVDRCHLAVMTTGTKCVHLAKNNKNNHTNNNNVIKILLSYNLRPWSRARIMCVLDDLSLRPGDYPSQPQKSAR